MYNLPHQLQDPQYHFNAVHKSPVYCKKRSTYPFFQQFTLETSQVSVPFVRKMKPPKSKAKSKGAGAPTPTSGAGSSDIRSSPPLEPPE